MEAPMRHTILVVDDNRENLKFLKGLLESRGMDVHQAPSPEFGSSLLRKNVGRYSLALLDYHMPSMMGDEATKLFHKIDRDLQVITISGDDTDEAFEKNLKAGSFLFLNRSISSERLISIVESYCKKFEDRKFCFSPEIDKSEAEKFISTFEMVGASAHLVDVCKSIQRYSKSDSPVLILGENGTGKERVARSIHEKSEFSKRPFVSVNCGAISEGLIESELFGHVKGAFTGAVRDRLGCFREADGGTIFLDEIGDMPMSVQVKLLRVLQEKEITPVGSSQTVKVRARIVAATNVDIERAVKNGKFREDLFYRLNVLPVALQPLRSRTEDIEPLVRYFLSRWKLKTGEEKHIRSEVVQAMKGYRWPGNVRELENILSRLFVRVEGNTIEYAHLLENLERAAEQPETQGVLESYHGLKAEFQNRERQILGKLLQQTGSLSKTAKLLKVAKSTLSDRLKNLGVPIAKNLTEEKV
jgi:DNA-binding NtrC family response regulator